MSALLLFTTLATFTVLNQFDLLDQELDLLEQQIGQIEHSLTIKRQAQDHVQAILHGMDRARMYKRIEYYMDEGG